MTKVFIDGREGTTGLRIQERLSAFADISLLTLDETRRKDSSARRELLHEADIAFLCLPDDAAKESVALAEGAKVHIIDASTAHRTAQGWSYGFPELSKAYLAAIKSGSRIAVPGCHASGFLALAYPLIAANAIEPSALLNCFSLTGYSGGGKKMIAEYENPTRGPEYAAPRQYATAQSHKHLPEMRYHAGLQQPPIFNPVVADFYAGMLVSVPLHASSMKKQLSPQDIQSIYAEHYDGCKLVNIHPYALENLALSANALVGSDRMEIRVEGQEDRITLFSHFDNLGKGASGAAIQCMNIMLGRDETAGLAL